MDLDVVLLGTAASVPTAFRAPAALLVRRGGERLLFDCAEGTQRQLMRSTVGLPDIDAVYLTHYHADHILGLPGMLKTFALRDRDRTLVVHGPAGLEKTMSALRAIHGRLSYPLRLVEVAPGDVLPGDGYAIHVFPLDHGTPAVGYALVEDERPGRFDNELADQLGVPFGPERGRLQRGEAVALANGRVVRPDELIGPARRGRKIVIGGDTGPSKAVVDAAQGADVLVHEATFTQADAERARETNHSTAAEAAQVGAAAGARLLVLTHVSARYRASEIRDEAQALHPAVVVPRDFDVIEVPFPERGEPVLLPGGVARYRERLRGHGADPARDGAPDAADAEELEALDDPGAPAAPPA